MNEKTDADDACVSRSRAAKVLMSALAQRVNITAAFSPSQEALECVASGQRSSLISVERAQLLVTDCG
jgi:hypothetical protein